jgi:hypothetical protein
MEMGGKGMKDTGFIDVNGNILYENDYFKDNGCDKILNQIIWVEEHKQYMGYQVGTLRSLFGMQTTRNLEKVDREQFEKNYNDLYRVPTK